MPEQEEHTFKVRTRWTGWMQGTQTMDWPDEPVTLRIAQRMARLARTASPVALVEYDVVDVRTGETVTEQEM